MQEKNISYSPTSALNSDLHPVRPGIQEKTADEMEELIEEKADEKGAEDAKTEDKAESRQVEDKAESKQVEETKVEKK